ncbi:the 70-Kda heat shock cognate protein from rattus Norvegicus in post-Atp hydrolysis state [Piromyces finnis]|uniref:The 70-kDa heat shock cognate protein from rattus Norvegicus in post-Atp hydrolysis state n=1 Tax=Piromyces finnis TaxID=1754191 RepID=A0A1Y1UZL5_9FUNG|nr:the 70-Kda heat shock cognate protein from rattus Norvegicus in post-Atp hydrolysis state [Piromyces finnis]|eukprot:ORX43253.1 the 70-Kda heat shock cognate protein from rattus Norvegicus in post-Atp hydrolysis state [Piromyces finnis]
MSNAVGIDLGTTYSCIAVCKNGHVEVIANDQGHRTTPSCILFHEDRIYIGKNAEYKYKKYLENYVYDVKRLIGREYSDPNVQSDLKYWPFKVIERHGKPYIQVEYGGETNEFIPEQISAMILSKLKDNAQDYLGEEIKDVVITVPAYFNDAQRRATRDAGRIAGLNVLQIINEPTAAALAYGLNRAIRAEKNILIFDLGGGTFDISILTIKNGIFKVKATTGDTHLGGEDFTNCLVDYFAEEFKRKYDKDLSTNPRSLNRLKGECEHAKCILSFSSYAPIEIEKLYEDINFFTSITRSGFEELISKFYDRIIELIERAFNDTHLNKSDISEIVMVGGSTRIPKIQELVSSYFDGKKIRKTINPDEAVAQGAAIQAACLSGDQSESIRDYELQDAIPLSLGVESEKGLMSIIIKRNSTFPIKKTVTCITCEDNQNSVFIRIFQGERSLVKDNILLGEFILEGITEAPCGETLIELTIDIDKNGIINVSAVEVGTGLSREITISNNKDKLYQEEIERLINEAEMYREED